MQNTTLLVSTLRLSATLVALTFAHTAHATEGPKYVALRQKLQYDRTLAYSAVQSNPLAYTKRILEIRGTVGGRVGGAEGMMIMLTLPDKNEVSLDVPAEEIPYLLRFNNTPSLRILVEVQEAGISNNAPLKALALSHESEVSAIENAQKAQQREIQRREDLRKRQQARSSLTRVSRGSAPHRGGFGRTAPVTGDLQQLANYYQNSLGPRVRELFVPYTTFVMGQNRRLTTDNAALITANLLYFADRFDVDPRLVAAMIIAESNFDPNSTSRTGAQGLGQLMPGTAQSLGVNNAYDPIQNLRGCIQYLRNRLDLYSDKKKPGESVSWEQIRLAMAAYNAGAGAVKKHGGVPPYRETQAYVRRVEQLYRQLSGQ